MTSTTSSLIPIADRLWCVPGEVRMPGGVTFPCRMVVVQLSSGQVWLHSPVALSDAVVESIQAIGPVAFIVAPNMLHHLFLEDAMARFPEAKVYGAPGLADKRKDLTLHATLERDTPADGWQADLDQLLIEGVPDVNEVVFLHKPSQSLIVTDLIFHMHSPRNWQTWLVLTLAGVRGRFKQSRLFRFITRDRQAAGDSVARMLNQWEFNRVIMAHGDVLHDKAPTRVREALSWMLSTSRHTLPAPA